MERRTFLRTGVAAGLLGAGAGLVTPRRGAALAAERWADGPVRLSSNENPLGISPMARQAIIDGMVDANRYPGDTRRAVTAALAALHGVSQESIAIGAGSTEVLRIAVHGLAGSNGRLVVAEPTFEDVPGYGRPATLPVTAVPLRSDWSHDIPKMRAAAARGTGPVLIFICNPNNPTGTLTSSAEVDEWIAGAPANHWFLVDEAYIDFVTDRGYWSGLKWIASKPNVIVSRTFSKVYGMAGLRLGYAIAHPDTIAKFEGVLTRNNPNHLAGVAALASLKDREFYRKSVAVNAEGKRILTACLDELGIGYLPSHTNFVMHRIAGDLDSYNQRMEAKGFLVGRKFPPLLNYSRVSIGLPADMQRFVETLREFRAERWI